MSERRLDETQIAISFPQAHRALLGLFTESRDLPLHKGGSYVQSAIAKLRPKLVACECHATRSSYERYLRYFAKRFNAPNLHSDYTLFDIAFFEQKLEKNPERYDYWLELALCRLAQGRRNEARHLLQRIAASGYPEAQRARKHLAALIDDALA